MPRERVPTDVAGDELVAIYARGRNRLAATIGSGLRRGLDARRLGTAEQLVGDATQAYRERQYRVALGIIDELEREGTRRLPLATRSAYASAIRAVDKVLVRGRATGGSAGVEGRFGGVHERAIAVLAANGQASLERATGRARANVATVFERAAALDGALSPGGLPDVGAAGRLFVGRRVDDAWRKVGLDVVGEGLVTLETRRQLTAELAARLVRDGVTDALTGYVDRAGRRWALDTYAEVVIRTTTREATSRATVERLTERGLDLVTVTSHPHVPDECSPYDGQTFSLSGKSTAFPRLDKLPPFHPRCRHVLSPSGANLDEFERELGLGPEPPPPDPPPVKPPPRPPGRRPDRPADPPPAPELPGVVDPNDPRTPFRREVDELIERERAATRARAAQTPESLLDRPEVLKAWRKRELELGREATDPATLAAARLQAKLDALSDVGFTPGESRLLSRARVGMPPEPDAPISSDVYIAWREEQYRRAEALLDELARSGNDYVELTDEVRERLVGVQLRRLEGEYRRANGRYPEGAAKAELRREAERLADAQEAKTKADAFERAAKRAARNGGAGGLDEESTRVVGARVRRELDDRLKGLGDASKKPETVARVRELDRQVEALRAKRAALFEARARELDEVAGKGIREWTRVRKAQKREADKLLREIFRLQDEARTLRNPARDRPELVRELLRELRDGFGDGDLTLAGTGRGKADPLVKAAARFLPREWVEQANAFPRILSAKMRTGTRANYRHWEDLITLGSPDASTALHELGHRMEYTVSGLADLESVFWRRRAKGERPKWLGSGYAKHEVAVSDEFTTRYIGKDYGGRAWEVLTMGLEGIFYDKHGIAKDDDLRDFILGLLVGHGRP